MGISVEDLKMELTLRDAEVIRLNDIIILLESMARNHDNILNKCSSAFARLKNVNAELRESCADLNIVSKSLAKENAEYKVREVAEEISQIKIKVLLEELQKIDPLQYT